MIISRNRNQPKRNFSGITKNYFRNTSWCKRRDEVGVPVFDEGKFYIDAFKNSVNLGFSINGLAKEEKKLFEDSGKTMKHIKIHSLQDIDEEKIMKLLKLVAKKSRCEKRCL